MRLKKSLIFCLLSVLALFNHTNAQTKTTSKIVKPEILGVWHSDLNDAVTKKNLGVVTMTFTQEGKLIYDIDAGPKTQRINMVYKVVGDTIVSDQPSLPSEQKTKYTFEGNDILILEFNGEKTRFIRQK